MKRHLAIAASLVLALTSGLRAEDTAVPVLSLATLPRDALQITGPWQWTSAAPAGLLARQSSPLGKIGCGAIGQGDRYTDGCFSIFSGQTRPDFGKGRPVALARPDLFDMVSVVSFGSERRMAVGMDVQRTVKVMRLYAGAAYGANTEEPTAGR